MVLIQCPPNRRHFFYLALDMPADMQSLLGHVSHEERRCFLFEKVLCWGGWGSGIEATGSCLSCIPEWSTAARFLNIRPQGLQPARPFLKLQTLSSVLQEVGHASHIVVSGCLDMPEGPRMQGHFTRSIWVQVSGLRAFKLQG